VTVAKLVEHQINGQMFDALNPEVEFRGWSKLFCYGYMLQLLLIVSNIGHSYNKLGFAAALVCG
jgi:hypothetical protein